MSMIKIEVYDVYKRACTSCKTRLKMNKLNVYSKNLPLWKEKTYPDEYNSQIRTNMDKPAVKEGFLAIVQVIEDYSACEKTAEGQQKDREG